MKTKNNKLLVFILCILIMFFGGPGSFAEDGSSSADGNETASVMDDEITAAPEEDPSSNGDVGEPSVIEDETPTADEEEADPTAEGEEDEDSASAEGDVSYMDENGISHPVPEPYTMLEGGSAEVTLGTAGETTWYVADGELTYSRHVFIKGTVNIVLGKNANITCNDSIIVEDSNKVVFWGETADAGTLLARMDYESVSWNGNAAIGSRAGNRCGTIEFHSGSVTGDSSFGTVSAMYGAGIGSGSSGKPGIINIYGGTVEGKGRMYAAGIGGGNACESGNITITGGNVEAYGGKYGAGIGSGDEAPYDNGGTIQITGGTVYASGGYEAAGIGGGNDVSGGNIFIGGTADVEAHGSGPGIQGVTEGAGAGIGGGDNSAAGTILIEGGEVIATGGKYAAGIGTGDEAGNKGGNITITGGTIKATGGSEGAGIGGGNQSDGGNITISGGTVTASGGGIATDINSGGAGIGGGDEGNGGTIRISGGTVIATGGSDGAGIGGGDNGQGGDIEISGNADIVAKGSIEGAGIGSGEFDSRVDSDVVPGGHIKIYGGNILATGGSDENPTHNSGAAGIGTGTRQNDDAVSAIVEIIQKDDHVIALTANGGNASAGIGGGNFGNGANVTIDINGHSYVRATGKSGGAGIGSGHKAYNSGNLTIRNGLVGATGGDEAAGIGGGDESSQNGTITIYGGTVLTTGNGGGAGIGGGDSGNQDGTIIINGGYVLANGSGEAAAIGGGEEDFIGVGGAGGTVIIREPATVIAETEDCAAMPIGNAEDDTHTDYSLSLYDTARVTAGESDDSAEPKPKSNRVSACQNRENNWVKIEKCDHAWDQGTVTREPTCLENGVRTRTCSFCLGTLTEDIDALGHDWELVSSYSTGDRITDHYECTRCDATYDDVRDADHEHGAGDISYSPEKPATCTEDGSIEYRVCSCGAKFKGKEDDDWTQPMTDAEITIPALGHAWGDWNVTEEATCLEKGSQTRTCSRCDETQTEETGARGHNWGPWTVTQNSTATETGQKQRVCRNDTSHIENQTIPAKGVAFLTMKTKGSKKLVLSWEKITDADGYDIFFAKCSNKNYKLVKTIKGNKTFTWTKSGLKKKTGYKAYVKAYTIKNGKKSYISTTPSVHAYTSGYTKRYTNAKTVAVNKNAVSLGVNKTFQIKGSVTKLKKSKKLMNHTANLRYMSTDTSVATVTKNGVIKGVGKGTCRIYVYTHNGMRKIVKVTVL